MAAVSSPPTPPVRRDGAVPDTPVKPRVHRPDRPLYVAPPARPRTPALVRVSGERPRAVASPDEAIIVRLKPVRRKLFDEGGLCARAKDLRTAIRVSCWVCQRQTDLRTVVRVTMLEHPADKVDVCPRCALCNECNTMRPGPNGEHDEHVLEGPRVAHRKCMKCMYCGKTGIDHATKRKHKACSRKFAPLAKQ